MKTSPIATERIERAILVLRSHKVLLDSDLADLYQAETRTLVQAVKRNLERFPSDFMFQLNNQELSALRSQSVISNAPGRGGGAAHRALRLYRAGGGNAFDGAQ